MKKSQNITQRKLKSITEKILPPVIALAAIIVFWNYLAGSDLMPSFMMPSPKRVWEAFLADRSILWEHAKVTLKEAGIGLGIGIILSFVVSIIMDAAKPVYNALYPILVVTQTIPTVAIAPLLTLWMGFDMKPKIVLIVITTFFPIAVGLLDGYRAADPDAIRLLKSMGAGPVKRFLHIKLPYSLGYFFSGLKISVAYSIVAAVISEWLGGTAGLGVFMTRCRKSFAYARLFSVILYISAISLLLMLIVVILKWLIMPWERKENEKN